jgi:hypothetical protein
MWLGARDSLGAVMDMVMGLGKPGAIVDVARGLGKPGGCDISG